jgi:uncharacterized protein
MWYVNVPSQREKAGVSMEHFAGMVGLFVAGVIGGAINSVAGGGTLISFPALIAFGVPSIIANATNTAAVCPGSISSALAYRHDMPAGGGLLWTLILPSLFGGLVGAVVLAVTPESLFAHIVPFLILFATLLFGTRDYIARLFNFDHNRGEQVSSAGRVWGFCFQFFVAAYGGYFGAGIGILMLASLSLMGFRDIHRMNAIKTVLASIINGTALVYFILHRLIAWPLAILMAVGAVIGGYLGAHFAKGVDQKILRPFIVAVGLLVSLWLFTR